MTDTNPTLDLDALLAIVRKRTPGKWERFNYIGQSAGLTKLRARQSGARNSFSVGDCHNPNDAYAICAAVNNFEAVAERCKRAEEWNDYDSMIAGLTRQRDELLAACESISKLPLGDHEQKKIALAVLCRVMSVKGGTDDGKA